MRAIIQSRARGSGRSPGLGFWRRVGLRTAIRRDPRRAGHLDDIDPRRRLSGSAAKVVNYTEIPDWGVKALELTDGLRRLRGVAPAPPRPSSLSKATEGT